MQKEDYTGYVAIITGITGQDGSYLAEFLLEKGYEVHGLVRRCSMNNNTYNLRAILENPRLHIHYGDITDPSSFRGILSIASKADCMDPPPKRIEIYNLAAQSHVQRSFEMPEYTLQTDGVGVLHILETIRTSPLKDRIRFYQASTSELYGKVQEIPQSETTRFYPRSPYGVAKLYGFWITKNYREAYNLFALNGILFNHESPRRGEDFVTRKVTKAVAAIKTGKQDCLMIGNMDAKRDWGYAKDYVEAMWRMLQADKANDWVVATGQTHSVREFIKASFAYVGIDIKWEGSGVNEVGRCAETGRVLVRIDPQYFRPAEVELLVGNAAGIREQLGWKPTTTFQGLVEIMTAADLEAVKKG